jgi:hypothetical protein
MEPEENTSLDLIDQLAVFFPSTISRAETALSKYPIHNLSKTDSIDIHIHRKGEGGEADIQWAVSPSREYGEPRQLAYKLDTLIVNRRIDEAGRPIPRMIRLGSLRELCAELSLSPGGDNFTGLRLALLQNASAFITAKLSYRSSDGNTRKFEAGFTRYSVVFTGEEMPSGHRADAIHILLNEHYWKLLNKAQFRPLDYDYQRSLRPSAHRFYELVSYAIFGALSKGQPEARLLYSDYCLRAPQERYFDRARVQKQMYKIHLPHLESEYLAGVRYVKTTDAEGSPDWELLYTPGRRAKAHFAYFRKGLADGSGGAGKRGRRVLAAPGEESAGVAALAERGVALNAARELALGMGDEEGLLELLEWGDHLVMQSRPGSFRNPAGFYIHLVREGIAPPADFESTRRRLAREAQAAGEQQRELERFRQERAYQEYVEAETERYLKEHVPEAELTERTQASRRALRSEFPNMTPEQLDDLARRTVLAEMRRRAPVRSFEEYLRPAEQSPLF